MGSSSSRKSDKSRSIYCSGPSCSDLVAEFLCNESLQTWWGPPENPNYDENSVIQALASATNDIDDSSHDRVDYINDRDHPENRRWTTIVPTPSSPRSISGVIFRENGKI